MSVINSCINQDQGEELMLNLALKSGHTLKAHIFIEDGEHAVCVVLYIADKAFDSLRIETTQLSDVRYELRTLLYDYAFTTEARLALKDAVREEVETLKRIREHGPDFDQDWLGSSASRRMPEIIAES
ncbi:hypothetical protein HZA87_02205 [Candidatus Uhrbacteria bacterium]|nr:hypothetical protein [Candidatus Uhrbacteria bacterium]